MPQSGTLVCQGFILVFRVQKLNLQNVDLFFSYIIDLFDIQIVVFVKFILEMVLTI